MRLDEVDQLDEFVLLGPGFSTDERWKLITSPQRNAASPSVWLAEAETKVTGFSGDVRTVNLELEANAPALQVTLDDSTFTRDIESIRESIAAGDVYQVNYTLRARFEASRAAGVAARLWQKAIPRFAAWVRINGVGEFISASPEMLFRTNGATVFAEPMKGTCHPSELDAFRRSEKDIAELAMITDLLRDDLHHVCRKGSVCVTNARRFIELPYVVQTVSDIEGALLPDIGVPQLFAQLHPGGSVTGAPRSAAQQTIARLEKEPRRFYCGTLGFTSGTETRAALLIRTAVRGDDTHWFYGVGSGITWDSKADAELREVHLKLGPLGA